MSVSPPKFQGAFVPLTLRSRAYVTTSEYDSSSRGSSMHSSLSSSFARHLSPTRICESTTGYTFTPCLESFASF